MVKLVVGVKGTGKTKTLIEQVNGAINESKGCVVCIEKGTKLIHEIKYQARLIDTNEYMVTDAEALYGFVAGIYASNHDVTHVFIDSALKICNNNVPAFETFIGKIDTFSEKSNIIFMITSSLPIDEIPDSLKKYLA